MCVHADLAAKKSEAERLYRLLVLTSIVIRSVVLLPVVPQFIPTPFFFV